MKIVVLGGGESGVGAARLAQAKGHEVFLSDKSRLADHYRQILTDSGIPFEEETHTEARILAADEVVKSPGIPEKAEIVKKIKEKGIPIVSEIEFAARHTKAKIVAITGSNGKTTTTLLTYHFFKDTGFNVGMAGNVGNSFAELVIEDKHDWYVLEVSSFQLDNCYKFKPHISVITNITPDHLDRYEYQFEKYVDAKFRIIQSQTEDDFFIYYADNEAIAERLKTIALKPFALPIISRNVGEGHNEANMSYVTDDFLETNFCYDSPSKIRIALDDLPLKGLHNALNTMCALLACQVAGGDESKMLAALKTFRNAPHRLENVGQINGITFVNDSKATNVDSVFYALGSFKQPIVLVMGGVDKGNDYTQIEELVQQKVKALICLGKDNAKLQSFFKDKVPVIRETQDIREVITLGLELGSPGDVVLLSPACASFDLFRNYEDRGNQFRAAVADKL